MLLARLRLDFIDPSWEKKQGRCNTTVELIIQKQMKQHNSSAASVLFVCFIDLIRQFHPICISSVRHKRSIVDFQLKWCINEIRFAPPFKRPDGIGINAKPQQLVGLVGVTYRLQPARPPLKGEAALVCSRCCCRPADHCRADCSEMRSVYWLGLAAHQEKKRSHFHSQKHILKSDTQRNSRLHYTIGIAAIGKNKQKLLHVATKQVLSRLLTSVDLTPDCQFGSVPIFPSVATSANKNPLGHRMQYKHKHLWKRLTINMIHSKSVYCRYLRLGI